MDIFSHGLWTGAVYKGINLTLRQAQGEKNKRPFNVWLAVFWGVFPDLFAFTIPFIWFAFNLAVGKFHLSDIPRPGGVEPDGHPELFGNGSLRQTFSALSYLTAFLYSLSHSLVIFLLVIGAILLFRKIFQKPQRPAVSVVELLPWEMGGWLFHILLDVPTHTYRFFPTPVFWPLGGWKFDGYSWAHPLFLIVNYSAIAIVYLLLRYTAKRRLGKEEFSKQSPGS